MAPALTQDRTETRLQIVEEHIRAENAHDVDAVMQTFVENPVFVLNANTIAGQQDVRAFYEGFGFGDGGGFSNVHVDVIRRHVGEEAIIVEARLTGEHTGTWQGIEPTGREIEVPLCAVFPFDSDDALLGERVYIDGAVILQQLGVLS